MEIKDKIKRTAQRTRPYAYSFRVSEHEKNLLDGKVKNSGLSKTDYLIRALSDKPVVNVSSGTEILAELKRQGNNLNQAIKNCYFGHNTQTELLSAVAECKKIYAALQCAIGGG